MTKNIKDNLKKLLILVPLVLLATGAFAAYTFVGPTAAPTSNNTDGPIDISGSNQIKNGDLAVNAFQSRTGSDFLQQSQFTGLVNGGTVNSTNSTVTFGNSSDSTSVNNTGSIAIAGHYQSDSLKSGGGLKQLCANANGTFYLCGGTATVNVNPIYLQATYQSSNGSIVIGASLSEPTNSNIVVNLSATSVNASSPTSPTGTPSPGAMNYLKNMFAAYAAVQGACPYTSTPTALGTVTILGSTTTSMDTVPLPAGCDATNTNVKISSYSPTTTMGGRPIIAQ
jgi:hypothetical protein